MKLRLWLFLKLTRPLFLMGGIILYLLGAVMAWFEGAPFRFIPFLTGQLLVTSVQLMTHYANEYFDQEGDRLNEQRTWFSGGSGVLSGGQLSPSTAWQAARVTGCFGLIFLVLAGIQTPVLLLLGMLSLTAAWFYSAPPLALSGSGWGEVSASIVVAGMVPLFGYTSQTGGSISSSIAWVCLSLGLIHLAMLIAFEIPDYPSDRQSGKRTLAVRFGLLQAGRIHNLALILAFTIISGLALAGWAGARFAWLAAPLAIWQSAAIYRYLGASKQRYLDLTMPALALFAVTAALWLAGFVSLTF